MPDLIAVIVMLVVGGIFSYLVVWLFLDLGILNRRISVSTSARQDLEYELQKIKSETEEEENRLREISSKRDHKDDD